MSAVQQISQISRAWVLSEPTFSGNQPHVDPALTLAGDTVQS